MPLSASRQCRPAALALFAAGLALAAYGVSLGLSVEGIPGPGLWPAILGLALAGLGLSFRQGGKAGRKKSPLSLTKGKLRALAVFFLASLLWLLLLRPLGWFCANSLALLTASLGAGNGLPRSLLLILAVLFLLVLPLELVQPGLMPSGLLPLQDILAPLRARP